MKKRLFSALVAVAIALSSLSATAGELDALARDLERALGKGRVEVGRPATSPRVTMSRTVSDVELVAAMNRERAAFGLPPLKLNPRLCLAAQDRVAHMFDQRYFAHVAPDGTQPFTWVARRGYAYRSVGENLAVGYTTAGRVVDGWMGSPGHRQNILRSAFDEIGVAVAPGAPMPGYGGPTVVAIYAAQ